MAKVVVAPLLCGLTRECQICGQSGGRTTTVWSYEGVSDMWPKWWSHHYCVVLRGSVRYVAKVVVAPLLCGLTRECQICGQSGGRTTTRLCGLTRECQICGQSGGRTTTRLCGLTREYQNI